jgi:hypothetical protein
MTQTPEGEPAIPILTERKARGWTRLTMARQLREAADHPGEVPGLESLQHNIYRWERGWGVSERYRLLYCRVFGRSEHELFGDQPDPADTGPQSAPSPADLTGCIVVVIPPGSPRLVIEVGGTDPSDVPGGEPRPAPRLMVVTDDGAAARCRD